LPGSTGDQVDQFLREKVQPYTTQLEQKSAQATDATRLWNDLNAQPVDTYVAITEELFGPEVAQQLLAQVQTQLEQNQQPAPPGEAPQTPTPDPRLEAVLQYVENQQSNQYYDSQLQTITADPQYTDVDTALLHPFVAAADGDFARGIEMYREAALGFHAKYAPATAPPPTPEAPNVIASDTATGSTPPVVPQKESLGEAIEAVAREWRTAPAPPVGTA